MRIEDLDSRFLSSEDISGKVGDGTLFNSNSIMTKVKGWSGGDIGLHDQTRIGTTPSANNERHGLVSLAVTKNWRMLGVCVKGIGNDAYDSGEPREGQWLLANLPLSEPAAKPGTMRRVIGQVPGWTQRSAKRIRRAREPWRSAHAGNNSCLGLVLLGHKLGRLQP